MKNKLSKKIIKSVLHISILVIISAMIVGSFYLKIEYASESAEEFFFYFFNGVTKTDFNMFINAIKSCYLYFILIFLLLILLFYPIKKDKIITIKKIQLYPIKIINNHKFIFTIILFFISSIIALNNIKFFGYLKNNIITSNFIENNYVAINKIDSTNKKTKNLISIYVESLETTFFSKEHGGDWDYEVIEELYELYFLDEAIHFSSNDNNAGTLELNSTGWTTASVISSNTGLPFKVPINKNNFSSKNFMNGSYALGDLLKDNGYTNEIISSAKTSFGGLNEFFVKHGDYNIIDIDTLKDYNLNIEKKDLSGWGFSDKYLFESAKKRLDLLSKSEKPFNLTLIGCDTHPVDGNVFYYTNNKFKNQYENVYATESKLIYDFIMWLKKQDYYKDTTIVIYGDHPSMQTKFFENKNKDIRKRYNLILNSSVSTNNVNNRKFTSIDLYPTTLAAMGFDIKDSQIALGVNLFSDKKTLVEKYGIKKVNKEIDKKSLFYNEKILGKNYYNKSNVIIKEEE